MHSAHRMGHPYHIAILDSLMPDMDGKMLGSLIKGDTNLRNTSLVMLTSSGYKSEVEMFELAGFDAYLVKPARSADLLDAVTVLWGATLNAAPLTSIVTRHSLAEGRERTETPVSVMFPNARILVAEDNPINQKLVRRILEKSGCQVDLADNGAEAVKMWAASSYDMVLMDCQMPIMDGFEAVHEIRRREADNLRRTPIVALTANTMQGDRDKGLQAGMDDFISKPFNSSTLHSALQHWIGTRTKAVELGHVRRRGTSIARVRNLTKRGGRGWGDYEAEFGGLLLDPLDLLLLIRQARYCAVARQFLVCVDQARLGCRC
jgi:CheY-like chemotaxis protein